MASNTNEPPQPYPGLAPGASPYPEASAMDQKVQPGYAPPGGQNVIISQPTVVNVVGQQFRNAPVQTTCPNCHAEIITSINYETGTMAWLTCALTCVFGGFLGCCLIPLCVDGFKDVIHVCPNCQHVLARWSRM